MKDTNSENWNPEDWQGRTKKQYESSGKALAYSLLILGLVAFITYFFNK
jgi:hypothetical protein